MADRWFVYFLLAGAVTFVPLLRLMDAVVYRVGDRPLWAQQVAVILLALAITLVSVAVGTIAANLATGAVHV